MPVTQSDTTAAANLVSLRLITLLPSLENVTYDNGVAVDGTSLELELVLLSTRSLVVLALTRWMAWAA